ncbi:MAG: ATP-binding protein [Candidatus Binatia bacterium]
MRPGTITLRIDSRLEDVWLIGLAVRAVCSALPLDEETTGAVELCVVEAVNNAIEHAYGEAPGQPVEVEASLAADTLRLAVRDRGRSMPWPAPPAAAPDGLNEGGRGLFIMRELMDDVDYATVDGWNVLTLTKHLTPRAALRRSGAA